MNRDQWNNVFEFVKAFGDFDDHGAYDPDGGIFQNLAYFPTKNSGLVTEKSVQNPFEILSKHGQ